jgi:hypothetical protein
LKLSEQLTNFGHVINRHDEAPVQPAEPLSHAGEWNVFAYRIAETTKLINDWTKPDRRISVVRSVAGDWANLKLDFQCPLGSIGTVVSLLALFRAAALSNPTSRAFLPYALNALIFQAILDGSRLFPDIPVAGGGQHPWKNHDPRNHFPKCFSQLDRRLGFSVLQGFGECSRT